MKRRAAETLAETLASTRPKPVAVKKPRVSQTKNRSEDGTGPSLDLVVGAAGGSRVGEGVRQTDVTAIRLPDGTLTFADCPSFTPNLTPEEVLRKGSFGGGYFRDIYSSVTRQSYKGLCIGMSFTGRVWRQPTMLGVV